MSKKCPISAQLVIPASFAECLTYEKQIQWLKREIDSISTGVEPAIITEIQNQLTFLLNEITNLHNEIDGYNIQAIQESIEQLNLNVENLKNSIELKQDKLTFDDAPLFDSLNPVTSTGIKEAIDNEGMRLEQLINDKVDETTFNDAINNIIDNYATNEELANYATKSEISDMATKTELNNYATKSEITDFVTNETFNNSISVLATKSEISDMATQTDLLSYATKEELIDYVTDTELENSVSLLATKSEVANKQDKLTFDETPILNSQNPVTSDGIKKAIDAISTGGIEIDDNVTSTSENAVKSSGIYQFVQEATADFVNNEELANYATKSEISDMATKTELNNYATKSEITDFVTNETFNNSISVLATKSEISDMATQTDLLSYATKEELIDYVTDTELENSVSLLATKSEVANKQDKLTFDETPTAGSTNPVTSNGIKKAIDAISTGGIEIDDTVSQSSQNPVSSNGIYNFVVDQLGDLVTNEQLETKQDKLTFDTTPTSGSTNPVTSNGIKKAIDNSTNDMLTNTAAMNTYATKNEIPTDVLTKTEAANTYATKNEIPTDVLTKTEAANTYATKEEIPDVRDFITEGAVDDKLLNYVDVEEFNTSMMNKQDKLTFDETPTEGSSNPVTSNGIFNVVNAIPQKKRLTLSNNLINSNVADVEIDSSTFYMSYNHFTIDKIELEYEKDVYNHDGMWFLDCNLIVTLNLNYRNITFEGIKPGLYKTTHTQNKEWFCREEDIIVECYSRTSSGSIYSIGNYKTTNGTTNYSEFSSEINLIPDKTYTLAKTFVPANGVSTKMVFTVPMRIVSRTQFTVDTAII